MLSSASERHRDDVERVRALRTLIEVVDQDRCIACDRCVDVCPTRVFDRGPDGIPVIARAKSVLAKLEAQDRGQTARALAEDLPLFAVPSRSTPLIQQVHQCLYHYLCEHVERRLAAQ